MGVGRRIMEKIGERLSRNMYEGHMGRTKGGGTEGGRRQWWGREESGEGDGDNCT